MGKPTLFDNDSSSEDGFADTARGQELKINQEYAKRFEHNKKRAEIHRLEEKYKPKKEFKPKGVNGDEASESEESSSDEDEDEDGFLATEAVDAEWAATLAAIKSKDPSIYNSETKFFNAFDDETAPAPKEKQAKPMTLHDYHRERYMAGDTGADDEAAEAADAPPKTFVQEQADLKKELLAGIQAEGDSDSDDDFIKAKPGQTTASTPAAPAAPAAANGMHPSRQAKVKPKAKDLDLALADKDPDLYLSNYMAARAWAAPGTTGPGGQWTAFESDDEGDDDLDPDEWEAAYNLRFEDPAKSNEVLTSYSRKVVEARSVRRDEPTGRRRLRELEKERKAEEKRQRHEERARLKRLKMEEAEEKLAKIKKAAGLRKGQTLADDEWLRLLGDDWEGDKWEAEMARRFGDQYYAEQDAPDSEAEGVISRKSKKLKKPKWDNDIDIKDILPDYQDDEDKAPMSLSDLDEDDEPQDEEEEHQDADLNSDLDSTSDAPPSKKRKTTTTTTKALKAARQASKHASRLERAKLEALVDTQLELQDPSALRQKPAASAGFRYRETSPQAFGLTPRDILLAPSDTALNEFVGLKKLATFRDRDKKQKDKKRLGKKARLREWRREVFGREFEHTGPTFGFSAAADGKEQQVLGGPEKSGPPAPAAGGKAADAPASKASSKKRKRTKGKKKSAV